MYWHLNRSDFEAMHRCSNYSSERRTDNSRSVRFGKKIRSKEQKNEILRIKRKL
jgi:hypothetical protein